MELSATYRKNGSLSGTEEETGSKETSVVVDETLEGGDETPTDHEDGKQDVRADLADEQRQGQLGDDVRDIGDSERDRVLVVREFEVRHETSRLRVTDVTSLFCQFKVHGSANSRQGRTGSRPW